ncbi:Uncharacterised protein [Anaerotruncus sp. 2789STDY5834896]|uniref:Glycosyltransferase RgtA/B/C/D-like domain-containing protein n=1 Tax=uncultured Anaerotruncus sp. TaxID=905011 RepID=A0A1C6I060_9FIRM|nr:Uncharacterised protein [uncultured Anaerotruncus sp.]
MEKLRPNKKRRASYALSNEWSRFCAFLRDSKLVLFISSLFLLLAYGIKLNYPSVSIDTEVLISQPDRLLNSWLSSGRFGLVYLKKILALVPFNPYVTAFLMLLALLLTGLLLGYLLYSLTSDRRKGKIAALVSSAVLLTYPSLSEQFNFMLQSFEVALALALCVISVILVYRWITEDAGILFLILSVLTAAIGFSCYQSVNTFYIGVVGGSFLFYCRQEIEKEPGKPARNYLRTAVTLVLTFLISFAIYAIINKIVIAHYFGPDFSSAYIRDQILWGKQSVLDCIYHIGRYGLTILLGEGVLYNRLFLVVSIGIMTYVFVQLFKKNTGKWWLFIAAAVFLYTPFLMPTLLGSAIDARVQLALPAVVAIGLSFLVSRIEPFKVRVLTTLVGLTFCFYQATVLSRMLYSDYLRYQSDVSLANKISYEVGKLGRGEFPDLPVVYVGIHNIPNVPGLYQESVIGHSFFEWDATTEQGAQIRISGLMDTLGYIYQRPSIEQIRKGEQYAQNMPVWPSDGSVALYEDMVVVKLSDK